MLSMHRPPHVLPTMNANLLHTQDRLPRWHHLVAGLRHRQTARPLVMHAAVRCSPSVCVLHTSTHHSRFLSLAHCTCLYPTATDSCGHATVSTPHQITPCRSLVFRTPACINTRTAQAIPSPSTSPCGTPHCRFLRGQRRRTRAHRRPLVVPRYTNYAVGSL